uniref:Uncharacterized protein n=1 Tax=Ixodes ricinus TaxID=34613 RepID=A0A6B0UZU4_IXORI
MFFHVRRALSMALSLLSVRMRRCLAGLVSFLGVFPLRELRLRTLGMPRRHVPGTPHVRDPLRVRDVPVQIYVHRQQAIHHAEQFFFVSCLVVVLHEMSESLHHLQTVQLVVVVIVVHPHKIEGGFFGLQLSQLGQMKHPREVSPDVIGVPNNLRGAVLAPQVCQICRQLFVLERPDTIGRCEPRD